MMRMMMRLQKTQVPSKYVWNAGASGTFAPHVAAHAGYRQFELGMVGASGGKGGNAGPSSNNRAWGGGPGGGGLIRLLGTLTSLSVSCSYSVGAGGADGASTTSVGAYGEPGKWGGDTTFGAYKAGGGGGGGGGIIRGTLDHSMSSPSYGGDAQNNTPNQAPPGGTGGYTSGGAGGTYDPEPGSASSVGDLISGRGGGGGMGRLVTDGYIMYDAQPGADGNVGFGADGNGGLITSNKGGAGGGGNLATLMEEPTLPVYGSREANSNPDGVIVLKLS